MRVRSYPRIMARVRSVPPILVLPNPRALLDLSLKADWLRKGGRGLLLKECRGCSATASASHPSRLKCENACRS